MIDFDKGHYKCRLCKMDLVIQENWARCEPCKYYLYIDGFECWQFYIGKYYIQSSILPNGREDCRIFPNFSESNNIYIRHVLMPDITEDELKVYSTFA